MPSNHEDSEEEEDYMSMIIEEPTQKETFSQRKRREQREAEARGRVPSKAERAAQEAARRDEALAKSTLDPTNKGFKMMAKLGFKEGQSLGKQDGSYENKSSQPINPVMKEGRGGIGLDSEKKRKIREEAEEASKKVKQEEGDYRDRVREERELKRTEAQVRGAQKVAERLDTEAEEEAQERGGDADAYASAGAGQNKEKSSDTDTDKVQDHDQDEEKKPQPRNYKTTKSINILYRGLVREREDRERDMQARHALHTSLPSSFFPNPRLPTFAGSELEREDQQALGTRDPLTAAIEQEVDDEDPELDAFNELEASERLRRLVAYLRETYRYCFWCKYRYASEEELELCPGLTEEDHD